MVKENHFEKLETREASVTLENILDNSKANSGGERDVNFLKYLVDSNLLVIKEAILKRKALDFDEGYYVERYKKVNFESDRHFFCRSIIQDELKRRGIETMQCVEVGNMSILRSGSNYDIVTADFSTLIDVGLTPARNYFRGLTDTKVRNFMITSYFDDYMDDIIFCVFARSHDQEYLDAIKGYEEGFKNFTPSLPQQYDEKQYYH